LNKEIRKRPEWIAIRLRLQFEAFPFPSTARPHPGAAVADD